MRDASDWTRISEVAANALAVAPAERASYVRAQTQNDEIRRAVMALLDAHERSGDFLAEPAWRDEEPPAALEGRLVGPYAVGALIGLGGMGEVYRAVDTRLDRVVALKVLPRDLVLEDDARERLRREARAIAALSHPNICRIYDIGLVDGVDFLVLEHLEGETLAARLARGRLPFSSAIKVAAEIADALEAVHRAGLVHRDLTPANVMLTQAGAKLLDFGLSRAWPMAIATSGAPRDRTLTQAGAVPGTAGYVAPELLQGLPPTAQSDLFAFGAVLHELATGRRVGAALDRAAEEASDTAVDSRDLERLPPSLKALIVACLRPNPDERWRAAADAAQVLRWLANVPPNVERPSHRAWGWRGVAIAMVLAGAIAAVMPTAPDSLPASRGVQFDLQTPATSEPSSFALSPDGSQLAFVGRTPTGDFGLWLRALDHAETRLLDGTSGATFPFWSADGQSLAFFAGGKLKRLSLDGGTPMVLAEAWSGRGGTWNHDDVIVFAPSTAGPLQWIRASGGTPAAATALGADENSHRWPQFLPDGRTFLYLSTQGPGGAPATWAMSLDGGPPRKVVEGDSSVSFLPPDRLLFARAGSMMAVRFDPARAVVKGEPELFAQPIGFDTATSRAAVSAAAGVVAYRSIVAERRQLVWVDRGGRTLGQVAGPDELGGAAPELSPDERDVALFRTADGNDDVWIVNLATGAARRLSFSPLPDMFPVWAPDGARLAFLSVQPDGRYFLVSAAEHDRSTPTPLLPRSQLVVPTGYSADGRYLLYGVQVPETGVDLWVLPTAPGEMARPLIDTPFDDMAGQFSPDGRWVAFQSTVSGRSEIYVAPFARPHERVQVSTSGGTQPRWHPDGRELFYVDPTSQIMAVPVRFARDHTFEAQPPVPLFRAPLATGVNVAPAVGTRAQYTVTRDGRFLMNRPVEGAGPPIRISVLGQPQR